MGVCQEDGGCYYLILGNLFSDSLTYRLFVQNQFQYELATKISQ